MIEAKTQRDRFIEAAKELSADENEVTFKAKLARIARQKVGDAAVPKTEKAASDKKRPSDAN